jgi:glycosyltransferase involved in cell wall biosynthesis
VSIFNKASHLPKIAVIGNYLPRQCGIATFTTDLCSSLAQEMGRDDFVGAIAMDDTIDGYAYPSAVKFQIQAQRQVDYLRAAEFINVSDFDAVILQHEYGIFGGKSGTYIIHLLKQLRMPIIATLHTVLDDPTEEQRAVLEDLANYCARLVVMSTRAISILNDVYNIPEEKTILIPHGIPDLPFVDASFHKDQFGVERNKVLLTFGLLSPGKGIEHLIDAMPEIIRSHPDVIYMVLGATHPHIRKISGEAYRHSLQQKVAQLGIEDHVQFHNQFVTFEMLCQYIGAADVYITPYLSPKQITSGTLAYTLGAGKAVVSTPYWYAEELIGNDRGRLVPFANPEALSTQINELLSDDIERNAIRKRAYQHCRPMVWKEVARSYLELIDDSIQERTVLPQSQFGQSFISTLIDELPEVKLNHLLVLTDDTGIIQHAKYSTPNRYEGYCSDDNARALIASCMHYDQTEDETVIPLIHRYLSFLHHAYNYQKKAFRNFMSYDRRWLEEVGSEDSQGRTMWALGAAVRFAPNTSIRDHATHLFTHGLPMLDGLEAPRAWAFSIIGLHHYLAIYGGDASARRSRNDLAERLFNLYEKNHTPSWLWFEDIVTYSNAKLSQALLLAGQWIPNGDMFDAGLESLRWLLDQHIHSEGHLSLIGNDQWYRRNGEKSNFDQQPVDAMCLVEACVEAYRVTRDKKWLEYARLCFAWFLGRNDCKVPMYNFVTGGCHDGLEPDGVNANQGAESTLAWLISVLNMKEMMG